MHPLGWLIGIPGWWIALALPYALFLQPLATPRKETRS